MPFLDVNEIEEPLCDFLTVEKLSRLLDAKGKIIPTIPVGMDDIFAPFHRIYGTGRLPVLLHYCGILDKEFWVGKESSAWGRCDEEIALRIRGNSAFYALGLFVFSGVIDR